MSVQAAVVVGTVVAVIAAACVAVLMLVGEPEPLEPIQLTPASTDVERSAVRSDTAAPRHDERVGVNRYDAQDRALTAAGGGEIFRTELEEDDGHRLWEVHIAKDGQWYEVRLAADDGTVQSVEVEQPDIESTSTVVIRRADANRLALDVTQGGTVRFSHLDEDGGVPEWELVVVDNAGRWIEVTIDAATGRVTDVDVENPSLNNLDPG